MPDPNSPEMMRARARATPVASREVASAAIAVARSLLKARPLSSEERAGGGVALGGEVKLSSGESAAAAKLERLRKAYPT